MLSRSEVHVRMFERAPELCEVGRGWDSGRTRRPSLPRLSETVIMQESLSLEGEMESEDVEREHEWNGRRDGCGRESTQSGTGRAAAAAALLGRVQAADPAGGRCL
ncbi:MAG: hypothetical protein M3434_09300 [Gemmatimonadota bacterium]|nr:hypothetical protein [Gemmatimonadota bacterium]